METGQKITQVSNNKIDNNSSNILSIQVSLSGLSFCVLNTDKHHIIYYDHIDFDKKLNPQELLHKLEQYIERDDLLNAPFNAVKVIYDNELFTLVPKALFSEDHLADYLKFNSRILQTDYITYDPIPANDSVCIFIPFVNINNFLYDRYGAFDYTHRSSVLVTTLLNQTRPSDTNCMYVHVSTSHFEIVVIEQNKLKFFNRFEYHSAEDFIYYVLFTAEQLAMNPEQFEVFLFGTISKDDALYAMVYKYIRNVQLLDLKSHVSVDDAYETQVSHNPLLQFSF